MLSYAKIGSSKECRISILNTWCTKIVWIHHFRVYISEPQAKVTDLRVQLYKKRQQQLQKCEENDDNDNDSLENARVTSSDEEDSWQQPLNRRTVASNRIVQKAAKSSPRKLISNVQEKSTIR